MRDTWPRWLAAIPGTALIVASIYALLNHIEPWACACIASVGAVLVAAGTGKVLHITGRGFTVGLGRPTETQAILPSAQDEATTQGAVPRAARRKRIDSS